MFEERVLKWNLYDLNVFVIVISCNIDNPIDNPNIIDNPIDNPNNIDNWNNEIDCSWRIAFSNRCIFLPTHSVLLFFLSSINLQEGQSLWTIRNGMPSI